MMLAQSLYTTTTTTSPEIILMCIYTTLCVSTKQISHSFARMTDTTSAFLTVRYEMKEYEDRILPHGRKLCLINSFSFTHKLIYICVRLQN